MNNLKPNWAVRNFSELVGLFDSKPRAFVMVGLFVVIAFMGYDLRRVYNIRAVDSEARLKRSEDFIYNRLLEQMKPELMQMRSNTDSAKAKVDSTVQQIRPLLEKVSETVNEINNRRK